MGKIPGKTVKILSELTLRKRSDIERLLLGAGLEVKSARKGGSWSARQETELLEERAKGKSFEEIGKSIGKSRGSCSTKYRRLTEP